MMSTYGTGSLSSWDREDFISEMHSQRSTMCSKGVSVEDRENIIEQAGLLLLCCSEKDKYIFEAHLNEMTKRHFMIMSLGL